MAHGEAKAVESPRWAMFSGNDDGDDNFKRMRAAMIAAAEAKDSQLLGLAD